MPAVLPTGSVPTNPHRTRPEHGEETKAQLIAIARELFTERGYAGVALQDLTEQAGVTRGALYHHFAGKDALFRAVCEVVAADLTRRVLSVVDGTSDAWSRLVTGCQAFLDACTEPSVQRILLSDAPAVLGWTQFRELDGRYGLGLVKSALQAAMDERAIEPAPVDMLAHLLVGGLNEAAMLVAHAPNAARARREATIAVDRILAGIADRRAHT
jgi:AcrR family transcriptional regulator